MSTFRVSGLRGNLFTVPAFGVSLGVSSIAEIQIDGGLYQKLGITEQVPSAPLVTPAASSTATPPTTLRTSTSAPRSGFLGETRGPSGDWQLVFDAPAERRQRVRPRQGHAGFRVGLELGKTIQSVRVVGNIGLHDDRQPD